MNRGVNRPRQRLVRRAALRTVSLAQQLGAFVVRRALRRTIPHVQLKRICSDWPAVSVSGAANVSRARLASTSIATASG